MNVEYPCPLCGAEVDWEADCPGYPGRGENAEKVMVCYPWCGNATRFVCPQCSWWHRAPNNRNAPDMGIAPSWLDKALAELEPSEDDE